MSDEVKRTRAPHKTDCPCGVCKAKRARGAGETKKTDADESTSEAKSEGVAGWVTGLVVTCAIAGGLLLGAVLGGREEKTKPAEVITFPKTQAA